MNQLKKTANLTDLATRINEAHGLAEESARSAVGHAVEAGESLIEAKAAVPHGQWASWVADHLSVGERTAQGYMKIAREFPKLDAAKAQRVADLPLRSVLTALSDDHHLAAVEAEIDRAMASALEGFAGWLAAMESEAKLHGLSFREMAGQCVSSEMLADVELLDGLPGENQGEFSRRMSA